MTNNQNIDKKAKKRLGANRLIFALDLKLDMDAETLVLHSGPKLLCFVVCFYKYFWFWFQTEIVSEKVYAVIWPVLEITSLKLLQTSWFFIYFFKRFGSLNTVNIGFVGWRASKLLAVKVRGLKKKSAAWPWPHSNHLARIWVCPGSNHSQSLMAGNFAAL